MRSLLSGVLALCGVVATAGQATAFVPLDGYLIARQACPATTSLDGGNPGRITTEIGRAYTLLGANSEAATHYRIQIEGAPDPRDRWVAVGCGEHVVPADGPGDAAGAGEQPVAEAPAPEAPDAAPGTSAAGEYVLALSWQPAFCETRPSKPECLSQTTEGFDAHNFTLHGLWPQPRGNEYCGVSKANKRHDRNGDWEELPELTLSPETRAELERVMPGTQSFLHRHEWIRHGTCYSDTPEEYFREALAMVNAVNASPLRALFAQSVGEAIAISEIRQAFDDGFEGDVGDRLRLDCARDGRRRLLLELRINLAGLVEDGTALGDLLAAADTTSLRGDCPDEVVVDPVGPQ